MSEVNVPNIIEWVAELRSGKYRQTRSRLYDGEGYCCLGVACEVSEIGVWADEPYCGISYKITGEDPESEVLPERIQKLLGLDSQSPEVPVWIADRCAPEAMREVRDDLMLQTQVDSTSLVALAALNDRGATFAQLADAIEATWVSFPEDWDSPEAA
jgi:hypothetical protein